MTSRILQWREVNQHHAVSKCGRYAVAKSHVAHVLHYQAWFVPVQSGREKIAPTILCDVTSFDLARVHCEQHAKNLSAVTSSQHSQQPIGV